MKTPHDLIAKHCPNLFTTAEQEESLCNAFEEYALQFTPKKESKTIEDQKVELMYSDGCAGREFYMKINGVRIELCINNGDSKEVAQKASDVFEKLKIDYESEIKFTHDGRF